MTRFSIILLTIIFSCHFTQAQTIQSFDATSLMKRASGKDTIYIINFWATSCIPCAKELPVFNQLQKYYENKPVKILLVSLDQTDAYPKKIQKFIRKKKLKPQVVWLSDKNPNVYIPLIDDTWQATIPATLVLQPGEYFRQFWEGTITASQVRNVVDKQLKYFTDKY